MKAVCNASPLITLAKAGLLDVLHAIFDRVVVPRAVVSEIVAGHPNDPCRRALSQTTWLEQVALDPPVSGLGAVQLGQGEAEVIEWALRHPEFLALLDDRAARRVAEALRVRCAGTLRVLYEASRRKYIASFAEGVAQLRAAGLHCDQRTVDRVCRQTAGELTDS